MWYVCDVLYALLYGRVSCFVVRGCCCCMWEQGIVGRVSVFGLWWCGWGVALDQSLEGWCYVCVSCEFGFSV